MEDIAYLYELRHYVNLYEDLNVAEILHVPVERVNILYHSNLSGSMRIKEAIKASDKDFEDFLNKKPVNVLEVENNNQKLIFSLKEKRKTFAGIGTNKAKRKLNTLTESNPVAKAVRIAIEIEDKNISARDMYGRFKHKLYQDKQNLINSLIDLFKEQDWTFGIQKSTNPSTTHIIFFEIPGMEQISWHINSDGNLQVYPKEWDGKQNILEKLETKTKELLS